LVKVGHKKQTNTQGTAHTDGNIWPRLVVVNPLNAELNPICHLLALLGAHHILHISWIRINYRSGTCTATERNLHFAGTHFAKSRRKLAYCAIRRTAL